MTTTIRMIQHMATPLGNYPVGTILQVSPERAAQLVKDQAAEYVDGPPVPETKDVKPQGETATKVRKSK